MANQRYIARPASEGWTAYDQTTGRHMSMAATEALAQAHCDELNGHAVRRGPDNGNHSMTVYQDYD